ncbi:MAG: DedA family protein [Deltaproteobacteria bacterium]|nr:DedA family protein [Deltaproteobacteria bacterium]
MSISDAIQFLTQTHEWVTLLILFWSAVIEYLFPPFPGDTVTLAGAVLVTAFGYPFSAVFLAVLAGSLAGAAADFWIGVAVRHGSDSRVMRLSIVRRAARGADRAVHAFSRHGEAYIVVNRFLPGIRAFLFVAAGMAGMRFGRVMLFAAISAAAWNLLVIGIGMAVGANIEDIEAIFKGYQTVAWTGLGVVAVVLLVRWWLRRRKGAR